MRKLRYRYHNVRGMVIEKAVEMINMHLFSIF